MNFYVLENPAAGDDEGVAVTDYISNEPIILGNAPRCPVCGQYTGLSPWLPPHRAELEVWRSGYGAIAFGCGAELLVTERFVAFYRAAKLTGLGGSHPVEITKTKRRGRARLGPGCPKYCCARVAHSRACVDVGESGLEFEEPPTCAECLCGHIVRFARVVIEEGTWSGEDIFYARGLPGVRLTSERFRDWFEAHDINNGVIIPATEYSFDFYSE